MAEYNYKKDKDGRLIEKPEVEKPEVNEKSQSKIDSIQPKQDVKKISEEDKIKSNITDDLIITNKTKDLEELNKKLANVMTTIEQQVSEALDIKPVEKKELVPIYTGKMYDSNELPKDTSEWQKAPSKNGNIMSCDPAGWCVECWQIAKVKINGVWYTPEYPWSCADIQNGIIDPLNFGQPTDFPMYGPIYVCPQLTNHTSLSFFSNCPHFGPGNPPECTPHFRNYIENAQSQGPWYQTWLATGVFPHPYCLGTLETFASTLLHEFIFNHPNNVNSALVQPGEYVQIKEVGPNYTLASSVDINFPDEAVEEWCFRYVGFKSPYDNYLPTGTPDAHHPNGAPHNMKTRLWLGEDVNIDLVEGPKEEECMNVYIPPRPDECGEIGDINPITGGILFAKPFTATNPTEYYYEVAPTDVNLIPDPSASGSLMPMPPGGTPYPMFATEYCGIDDVETITLSHATSHGMSKWDPTNNVITPIPSQGQAWTNRLLGNPYWRGDEAAQNNSTWYAIGIGPHSENPQIDALNYTQYINIGTKMEHFDINGDPCYLYNWDVGAGAGQFHGICDPSAESIVSGVQLIPANTPPGPSAPNPPLYRGDHPFDVLVIETNDQIKPYSLANCYDAPPLISACPGHTLAGRVGMSGTLNITIPSGGSNGNSFTIATADIPDCGLLAWCEFTSPYLPSASSPIISMSSSGGGGSTTFNLVNNIGGIYIPVNFNNIPVGANTISYYCGGPSYGSQNWTGATFSVNPVWTTKFINTITAPSTHVWPLMGLEWGMKDRNPTPGTRADFGSGYKNTLIIDGYSQCPTAPPCHPAMVTHNIAATEALRYGPINQLPIEEGEEWHLPSLYEFAVMMLSVGPSSLIYTQPQFQTIEHDNFKQTFIDNKNAWNNSEGVYWTSSQDLTGTPLASINNPLLPVNDPDDYAIAAQVGAHAGASNYNVHPYYTKRCQALTVRPIRRYKCEEEPPPEYNYRDSANIFLDGNQDTPLPNWEEQSTTPFVSIYTPGGSASVRGVDEWGGHLDGCAGVIGFDNFRLGLTTTDVNGNEYDENSFISANNPGGFLISIWDNQKNFIGTWHYEDGQHLNTRDNRLNWRGYLDDCANVNNPVPGNATTPNPNANCNGSQTYQTFRREFPDLMQFQFSHPTFIKGGHFGNHPVYRYGGNEAERQRKFFGPGVPPANPIQYSDCDGVPYNDWMHPYTENTFNGWTSSYAYIKVDCLQTQLRGANAFNPLDGENTDIDSLNVVCLRNLFMDTYQGYSPPNRSLQPSTGSPIGCGDLSRHMGNTPGSPLSTTAGYGWQFLPGSNPLHKGNSQFGDVYGINYFDGRGQEPGYPLLLNALPNGANAGTYTRPNLALHPKHWAFPWFGSFKPNSGGVNWYKDLHEGYESCYGYRCQWNIGDVGPAGGIIVAVPGMIGNEVTFAGATPNDSDWYYELSPIDLTGKFPTTPREFGMWGAWMNYTNNPSAAESNIWPCCGEMNSRFMYSSPYTPTGSGIAQTQLWPQSFLELNPPAGPTHAPNAYTAFKLCDDYVTYDQFGNEYCDWFLPSIQEWWYVCNNIPNISHAMNDDERNHLYWTSNAYMMEEAHVGGVDVPVWEDDLVAHTMYDYGPYFLKGQKNKDLNRNNAAYAVNPNEKIIRQGPISPGPWNPPTPVINWNWQPLDSTVKAAYVVPKNTNCKVRAMRRFRCPEIGTDLGGSTIAGGGNETLTIENDGTY